MTWRELAQQISQMTEEQQGQHVTVFDSYEEEYFGIYHENILFTDDVADVLDGNSPYLRF